MKRRKRVQLPLGSEVVDGETTEVEAMAGVVDEVATASCSSEDRLA